MTDSFDTDKFLDWLDEQQSPIPKPVMAEKFPNFPWDYVVGVTATFVDEDGEVITSLEDYDGEIHTGYYKRDLRRAARKQMSID